MWQPGQPARLTGGGGGGGDIRPHQRGEGHPTESSRRLAEKLASGDALLIKDEWVHITHGSKFHRD
jgi:hypothetical protein